MGASGRVTSPTFVIVHEHPRATSAPHAAGLSPQAQPAAASETRPTGLVHADLYRVRSDAEAQHLALAEYADDGWVVAVEWPERWHGVHEDGALVLSLTGSGEGARELHVISMPDWAAPALATVERA
jgi:tRNA A37 threonylcarbamoyladenosine biosynthesis protein TsaE